VNAVASSGFDGKTELDRCGTVAASSQLFQAETTLQIIPIFGVSVHAGGLLWANIGSTTWLPWNNVWPSADHTTDGLPASSIDARLLYAKELSM